MTVSGRLRGGKFIASLQGAPPQMFKRTFYSLMFVIVTAHAALGQAAQGPPDVYTGSFGGGIALTGGNTDTKTFNLTFDLVRDPLTKNVIKAKAAYLRGNQNDVLNLDRATVNLRDQYTISGRTFVFGQLDYLRDQFKEIIFLWAPSAGLGFKLANTDATKFEVLGGAGGIFEKNPGTPTSKSGSVTAGENFQQKISSTAAFTQSLSTIWKTQDFSDSLTNFSVGLVTSVARKIDVKVEFIDSYKTRPPSETVKKNDTAFVTTFVVKF
jgi:putative salt-induced outer membrane protein